MSEQSAARYQQLQNEEEPVENAQSTSDAPPPYSSIARDNAAFFDYKNESGFPKPPSYNVATSLPSYDEAERSKVEATIPLVPGRDDGFVTRDDFDDADQLRIGNDGIFMLTFFMAFLFNWIGFFLSFCLTTSAAGRYGAISGFGLSLIKWILIVRDSCCFSEDLSIMQKFGRCPIIFPLSPEPGFSLFIKVLRSLLSCHCRNPLHMADKVDTCRKKWNVWNTQGENKNLLHSEIKWTTVSQLKKKK